MQLLYINEIGKDYKNQKQYEFIFGNNIDITIDEWYIIPASGRAIPPSIEYIDFVGLLKDTYIELELVQNSDYFGVIDAQDGIVALGWETFDKDSDEDRPERLSFHYGENFNNILKKLEEKGLQLIKEEIIYTLQ